MGESLGATRSGTSAFGAALRSMRLAAGLSQGGLAERAGLSEKAVGALERGDRTTPRPATVVLLADAVGASPAERDRLPAAAHAEGRPTERGRPTDTDAASLARHALGRLAQCYPARGWRCGFVPTTSDPTGQQPEWLAVRFQTPSPVGQETAWLLAVDTRDGPY